MELSHKALPPSLQAVFPGGYSYILDTLSYSTLSRIVFSATVFINVTTEAGASKWIQDLEEHTDTTF